MMLDLKPISVVYLSMNVYPSFAFNIPPPIKSRCFETNYEIVPRRLGLIPSRTSSNSVLPSLFDSNGDANDDNGELNDGSSNNNDDVTYRIVAPSDGKLDRTFCRSPLLPKLHAIYHSSAHFDGQDFRDSMVIGSTKADDRVDDGSIDSNSGTDVKFVDEIDTDNRSCVDIDIRRALEDAGFCLVDRRGLELCKALNVDYLLRLAITPDLRGLDQCTGREFYPQQYSEDQMGGDYVSRLKKKGGDYVSKLKNSMTACSPSTKDLSSIPTASMSSQPLLFDGKILVFRRGYTSETSKGLLIGQKLDYLQSSLVQRSFSKLALQYGKLERKVTRTILAETTGIRKAVQAAAVDITEGLPDGVQSLVDKVALNEIVTTGEYDGVEDMQTKRDGKFPNINRSRRGKIKFRRCDGTLVRSAGALLDAEDSALAPFLVCEVPKGPALDGEGRRNDRDSNDVLDPMDTTDILDGGTMQDDSGNDENQSDRDSRLLNRVSISDLVNVFTEGGRKKLLQSFTSESSLVEPAFEEVVVIWRPLPPKRRPKQIELPDSVYSLAKTLSLEDRLPPKRTPEPEPERLPLQIRAFSQVPMANLLAILPKTKLIFRPTDAILFDLVNIVSLSVVLASVKTDNAYLDILALGSLSIWVVRTFIKYSNKQARYDLLVNKFLTQRMEHRNRGALDYVENEAAEQMAIRASLLHEWLIQQRELGNGTCRLTRGQILQHGSSGVNQLMQGTITATDDGINQPKPGYANVNIGAALNDLGDFSLIRFDEDDVLVEVEGYNTAEEILESIWTDLFQTNTRPTMSSQTT